MERALEAEFLLQAPVAQWLQAEPALDIPDIKQRILDQAAASYAEKVALVGAEQMAQFEHGLVLQMLDNTWREHLAAMDHLRQGIHLRGYAQKNPKQEYKREAFELFSAMLDRIKHSVVSVLMTVQVRSDADMEAVAPHEVAGMEMHHDALLPDAEAEGNPYSPDALAAQGIRVGRNDPCPCGSGQRYKQCHGKLA